MFGTGSSRQPPPAFQAASATANIAIWTQRGSSSSPKRLSAKDGVLGSDRSESLLLYAHAPEHPEGLDQEVT